MLFASPEKHRLARAGIALLCCALLGGLGAASVPDETAQEDGFVRILTTLEEEPSDEDLERFARDLARQPRSVTSYLDVLSKGHLPSADGDIAVALTEDQRGLLERTSRAFDAGDVVRVVRNDFDEASPVAWRRCALELLAGHATRDDLSLLGQLVKDRRGSRSIHVELVGPFQSAATEVGRRTGWDDRELRWMTDEVEELREPLLRAAGKSGNPEGLSWIADHLNHPQLGPIALQEIGRVGGKASRELARETALLVRPTLASPDANQRRQAIRALGELRDSASIAPLIGLLGEEASSSERSMAHSALKRITGLEFTASAVAWKRWFDEEQRWFQHDRPRTLERLASENDADVVAALRELSERRLHRGKIAARLFPVLEDHPSPSVRQQACLALLRLDSKAAIQPLTLALEDEELEVRDAAHKALRSIAGLPLPPDREAWRTALGLSK